MSDEVVAPAAAPGPPDASPLLRLVEVMDRLRRECPWDREQTHRSLARYLLEETHEVLEALDTVEATGDATDLREELGDLLLQVYFHARLAQEREEGAFGVEDVAAAVTEKLVRRHPHVFADGDAADADAVEVRWEELKAAEKQRSSVLDGVPASLPALALADKTLGRAERVGVRRDPWVPAGRRSDPAAAAATDEALGEELLAAVVRARAAGVDPEQALRGAVRRLAAEVRDAEAGGA